MAPRDSYRDVGQAMRIAIDKALGPPPPNKPPLSAADLRVMLGIVREVGSYSRLTDELFRQRVANITGLSVRQVSRSLNRLATRDVLVWEPSTSIAQKSLVGFPQLETVSCPESEELGTDSGPKWNHELGTESNELETESEATRDGYLSRHSGQIVVPHTEKVFREGFTEKTLREGRANDGARCAVCERQTEKLLDVDHPKGFICLDCARTDNRWSA